LPHFKEVQAQFGQQVTFVNISDSSDDPQKVVTEGGYGWTFGDSAEAPKAYNVQGYPTTVFINREGNVVDTVLGGMGKDQLVAKVQGLL
jgi:thioredoxin-related protein